MEDKNEQLTSAQKLKKALTSPVAVGTYIGTGLGLLEATIYYNFGKKGEGFKFPPLKEMGKIFVTGMIASVITSYAINIAVKSLYSKEELLAYNMAT